MSIHNRGRICFLNRWEAEERRRGIKPNCRNHRHISKAQAFDLSGNPDYGTIVGHIEAWNESAGDIDVCGFFVKVGGRIEFTITNPACELAFDQIRAKGLELETQFGIAFIDRKVPLRMQR